MILEKRREESFVKPFRELQKEIDRLFDDFFAPVSRRFVESGFSPEMDVYETDDSVVIEVEAPGLKKKDFTVKVEDNMLTISGEKKAQHEEKGRNYRIAERCYGKFQRSIALPDYLDAEKVKAKYVDGILEVTIPKREDRKAKTVEVKVE